MSIEEYGIPFKIEPKTLFEEYIKNPAKKNGIDYVIIDVRDADRDVGWIKGSINIPAHEFLNEYEQKSLDDLALTIRNRILLLRDEGTTNTKDVNSVNPFEDIPLVVFHCAYSQIRGPRCAARYAVRRWGSHAPAILSGGFVDFARLTNGSSKKKLDENLDEEKEKILNWWPLEGVNNILFYGEYGFNLVPLAPASQ